MLLPCFTALRCPIQSTTPLASLDSLPEKLRELHPVVYYCKVLNYNAHCCIYTSSHMNQLLEAKNIFMSACLLDVRA